MVWETYGRTVEWFTEISLAGPGKRWAERGIQILWSQATVGLRLVGEFAFWLRWGQLAANKRAHGHVDEELSLRARRLKVFRGVAKWWFLWVVESIIMGKDDRSVGGINSEDTVVPDGQMATDVMVGDTQLIQEKTGTQDTICRCKYKSEFSHSSMVSCVRSTLPPLFLCTWVRAIRQHSTSFNKGNLMQLSTKNRAFGTEPTWMQITDGNARLCRWWSNHKWS